MRLRLASRAGSTCSLQLRRWPGTASVWCRAARPRTQRSRASPPSASRLAGRSRSLCPPTRRARAEDRSEKRGRAPILKAMGACCRTADARRSRSHRAHSYRRRRGQGRPPAGGSTAIEGVGRRCSRAETSAARATPTTDFADVRRKARSLAAWHRTRAECTSRCPLGPRPALHFECTASPQERLDCPFRRRTT